MTWKRHVDQLRATEIQNYSGIKVPVLTHLEISLYAGNTDVSELQSTPKPIEINEYRQNRSNDTDLRLPERRYPLRNRRPPERLQY
ncbi:hypothetical protein DPMN_134280 [Dreissena polymorpha]|uniref:Uncharacterized protein n=1 Tax=Dreissena polymorpha TaxID=45954 RepID=A0A9D4JBS0_DREPO|nr:hypothetical protein DPMN_134280 [Dreissena polymorpha]